MEFREWLDQLFDLAASRDLWQLNRGGRMERRGDIVRWITGMPLLDWFRDGLSPDAACDRAYEQPDPVAHFQEVGQ